MSGRSAIDEVLAAACAQVGLNHVNARLLRAASNTMYQLPDGVVARVGRPGRAANAQTEVRVARWLRTVGVPVVEVVDELTQPVVVGDRAVTFWRLLPPHQHADVEQVAEVLKQLHHLVVPEELPLPVLDPFAEVPERIDATQALTSGERRWLRDHTERLRERYQLLVARAARRAVHGDPWAGNFVATTVGPVMLDLERFAVGPPAWDLTVVAINHVTFGKLSRDRWTSFSARYGHDVTNHVHFELLRDIRELRLVAFAARLADTRPQLRDEARYRLGCIQGAHGGRPWGWSTVP